jgi:hypothetical protein
MRDRRGNDYFAEIADRGKNPGKLPGWKAVPARHCVGYFFAL